MVIQKIIGEEEGKPLNPVETLRAMIALRDDNPNPLAKRLYALANPRYKTSRVLRYIADKEAFTFEILAHELRIPKPTLYDIVRELESWAVIHKGYSINMNMPGASPIMYVLANADPLKVTEAHKLHLELRTTSGGVALESPFRQMVFPFVEKAVLRHAVMPGGLIREAYVRKPFIEKNGFYSENVRDVVHRVAKELGYNILY